MRTMPGLFALIAVIMGALDHEARAFDFEYMETEQFYNTTVRGYFEKEFLGAMAVLESKARALNMEVRKIDIDKLQKIMQERALISAQCMDKGIRARTDNGAINLESYFARCYSDGLTIADQIERKAWSEWPISWFRQTVLDSTLTGCRLTSYVVGVRIFDFLKGSDLHDTVHPSSKDTLGIVFDNFAFKQCVVSGR
jgi:hypothetical protein